MPGLFVASGCNVGGLSTSPAVGEALAELIATGRSRYDLSIFSPDRFGPEYSDLVRLRAACRNVYEFQYWAERPSGTWAERMGTPATTPIAATTLGRADTLGNDSSARGGTARTSTS